MLQRVLSPVVEVRKEESITAILMFSYSFFAMTAYNIVQPITRSTFIASLGADNIPYVQFGAGLLIGVVMQFYGRLLGALPRRWALPVVQMGLAGLLVVFWMLFLTGAEWVSVGFYFLGLILGILLISQFWTVANDIYNPRQAKRLFGFIGGGASLGGMTGAGLTALIADTVGTNALLLWSATALAVCAVLVSVITRRERPQGFAAAETARDEAGVAGREALGLLRSSRQLQLIAVLISFAALGAAILDQQLNMATEDFRGQGGTDAMTEFLAAVRFYLSAAGFLIQVWLTSRIHRLLGIGFALLILPTGLSITGLLILLNYALWAPAVASVLDRSLRYTVDKTTREVLFLPLSADVKYRVKPFVDVTVDRFAKGLGALVLLVLIKPWGLDLTWQQLSVATLTLVAAWFVMAVRAKRAYLRAFRESIEQRQVRADQLRIDGADLSTIEALVEELAHPDEARVLYAIDLLESLDKRNLITPLLLRHEAPAVRARALAALGAARPDIGKRWVPAIRPLVADPSADVRAAAIAALAAVRQEEVAALARPLLEDIEPRVAATAAVVMAISSREEDRAGAEAVLVRLCADVRPQARAVRRDVAATLRAVADPRFHSLLVSLIGDPDPDVAAEALRTAAARGAADFLFVPSLVSRLKDRRLKMAARDVLVGYGEPVVDILAHFLRDPDENVWVRRHLPATIARIPCRKSVDVLIGALAERDGFLRYKAVAGLERLRRERPELAFAREPIEKLALAEGARYFAYLSLAYNLVQRAKVPKTALLLRALDEKTARGSDRIYRLLGLLHPWKDIAAARWAIERGDARSRASASEYLDNLLTGPLRKRLVPVLEDLPLEEKVRRGNVLLRTRPREVEETVLQLVHDDDPVIAATAIGFVCDRELWGLEGDIEYVLAHRDVRDWAVFEAASWALAARRVPERRRQLWQEPLPAAELAARLHRLPLFKDVSVDELFRVAEAGRRVRHDPGSVLIQDGRVPDECHVLIDGVAAIDGRDLAVVPPVLVGFEDALLGRPAGATVRTTETSTTLVLSTEELRTLLADSTALVQGLFCTLVGRRLAEDRPVVLPGQPLEASAAFAAGEPKAIEKLLALQRVSVFSGVSADEMRYLAALAGPRVLEAGSVLAREADPPAITVVVAGELSLEHPAGLHPARRAGPGDVVGVYETLAGMPLGLVQRVLRGGVALRIEHEDLFDLLGQRPALLQDLFSTLFDKTRSTSVAAEP